MKIYFIKSNGKMEGKLNNICGYLCEKIIKRRKRTKERNVEFSLKVEEVINK